MRESFWELLKDYWELALLLLTWLGVLGLGLRRRRDWSRKRFTHQVNFSLDYVAGDTLLLRTLLEDPAEKVWLNQVGVSQVVRAAQKTTAEQPVLRVPSPTDADQLRRAVVNVLSERYSEAFLARSLGLPVVMARYVYGVTWERHVATPSQKLRVILMEESQLAALFAGSRAASLAVEAEHHRPRIATLEHIYKLYIDADARRQYLIGNVELGVVTGRDPD